jgi:hypothetical protein
MHEAVPSLTIRLHGVMLKHTYLNFYHLKSRSDASFEDIFAFILPHIFRSLNLKLLTIMFRRPHKLELFRAEQCVSSRRFTCHREL